MVKFGYRNKELNPNHFFIEHSWLSHQNNPSLSNYSNPLKPTFRVVLCAWLRRHESGILFVLWLLSMKRCPVLVNVFPSPPKARTKCFAFQWCPNPMSLEFCLQAPRPSFATISTGSIFICNVTSILLQCLPLQHYFPLISRWRNDYFNNFFSSTYFWHQGTLDLQFRVERGRLSHLVEQFWNLWRGRLISISVSGILCHDEAVCNLVKATQVGLILNAPMRSKGNVNSSDGKAF